MATLTINVSGQKVVPILLSANLTALTLTNALDGQEVTLEFEQNSTGGWTVASANMPGLLQPSPGANAVSFQQFIWSQNSNAWLQAPAPPAIGGAVNQAITASGAVAATSGTVTLGGSGVDATTLVAPPSDGITITFLVISAHAHTITTPANKINGIYDTLTSAGAVGNIVTLTSAGGNWWITSNTGFTPSEV